MSRERSSVPGCRACRPRPLQLRIPVRALLLFSHQTGISTNTFNGIHWETHGVAAVCSGWLHLRRLSATQLLFQSSETCCNGIVSKRRRHLKTMPPLTFYSELLRGEAWCAGGFSIEVPSLLPRRTNTISWPVIQADMVSVT